jgi:hypothetical protein
VTKEKKLSKNERMKKAKELMQQWDELDMTEEELEN